MEPPPPASPGTTNGAAALMDGLLAEGVRFNQADPNEVFELVDLLGEGSYGAVYRAQYRHDPSLPPVAVKIIPADEDLSSLKREIAILHRCRSDYVVEFKDCFFADNELWIVMEFCMGGSVADMLDATEKTLTEPQIRAICACAALGLAYLHENHHIHRDLKAGNILLSMEGKAKLADFGVSAQLSSTVSKRKTVIGTPFWMAPEVIQETSYDGKADVWSLGITAIEMAEGAPPHYNVHPMRAIFLIPSKPPPRLSKGNAGGWSPEFHDFLGRCLVKDPAKRIDSHALLSHPFIAPDVQRLLAEPTAGLEPISDLVASALDFLARYRAAPTATEGGGDGAAASNPDGPTGAGDGQQHSQGQGQGEEDTLVRQRKPSVAGAVEGGGDGWPRHHHRPSVGGDGGSGTLLVAGRPVSHSRRGSAAVGDGSVHSISPSGTMVRIAAQQQQQEQQQRQRQSLSGSLQQRRSLSHQKGGGGLDVSQSGTMVRHVQQQQQQQARPTSQSSTQAGGMGLQSALRYLHGLGISGSGSSSSGSASGSPSPSKPGASPSRKPTAAGDGPGGLMTIADRLSASLSASYHERKQRDRKGATVEEVQGLLQSLEAQYQRDRIALEGAYLTQRRELEEALAAQQNSK